MRFCGRALVLLVLALSAPSAFSAGDSIDTEERSSFTLLMGGIDAAAGSAAQTKGEVVWDGPGGLLAVDQEALSQIPWKPSEEFRKARPEANRPPLAVRGASFTLERLKNDTWVARAVDLEFADDVAVPEGDRSAVTRYGVGMGRLFYAALAGEASAALGTFDLRTLAGEAPHTFEVTPLSSPTHADTIDPDRKGSLFRADTVLTRADGMSVEIVALHYDDKRTRALFANVWAGGSSFEGDRQALAEEGTERLRAWFDSLKSVEELDAQAIPALLEDWVRWRADVTFHMYVLELEDADGEAAEVAEAHDLDSAGKPDTEGNVQ